MADIEDQEEQIHFQKIVNAFKGYRSAVLNKIKEKQDYVKSMNETHQSMLSEYKKHLEDQITCVEHNAEIIKLIIKDVENMFENSECGSGVTYTEPLSSSDLDKIQSTIRQLVRDWSSCGKEERKLCYVPIINMIKQLYPKDKNNQDVQILVPGAGLGRLAYELAKLGYSCQGNEFSLFMLFVSNFILNRSEGCNSLRIYPWVHSGSNLLHNEDQIQPALLPDDDPSTIAGNSQLTMTAGDFLEIYTEESAWDCIATCFFIDCAKNIIEFIEAIYKILKPGGHWVNLGPLLYHFADQKGHNSIEPSWDIVKQIIKSTGFIFVKEPKNLRTIYTQNPQSLMTNEFKSIFFAAKKPNTIN